MRFTVGSVPYVNAKPLVWKFERDGAPDTVKVLYDVPSRLPQMLSEGRAQAVLVSSYEAISVPGRSVVPDVCIGSRGAVESVRVFSKVEPFAIRTLALDASSLTSNRLAQIVLAERYGVRPELVSMTPDLPSMLEAADACVLIGDIGMRTDGTGLRVLDLGSEWTAVTGLPFVWALWVGNPDLPSALAEELASAIGFVREPIQWRAMLAATAETSGWTAAQCNRYLTEAIRFELDDAAWAGLREFGRRLVSNGLDPEVFTPNVAGAVPV